MAEAGFEIAFDPPADGKCFCYAASFQIEFSATILTLPIFEYSFIIPYKFGMTLTCVNWVIPEKIHTSPMDGILEILTGGGVKDSGNPGRRGG